MNKFRERLQRMMVGRYGSDGLGQFLIYVSLAFIILSMFAEGFIFQFLVLVCLGWSYFRMFSKNIGKRYAENQKYEAVRYACMEWFRRKKFKISEKKDYHIYKCPSCGQKIRVPRGKGNISIHCPKCNTDFIKKS